MPISTTPHAIRIKTTDGWQEVSAIGGSSSAPLTRTFTYASDGDTNGVIYYLGSQGGQFSAPVPNMSTNPVCDGFDLRIDALGVFDLNYPLVGLVDRSTGNGATSNVAGSYVRFGFRNRRLKPTRYSLKTRGDADSGHPRSWVLEGSNDGSTWTTLDTRTNDTQLTGTNKWVTYTCTASVGYQWLRIRLTAANSSSANYLALGEVEFYGDLAESSGGGGGGGGTVYEQTSAPASPPVGAVWIDTDEVVVPSGGGGNVLQFLETFTGTLGAYTFDVGQPDLTIQSGVLVPSNTGEKLLYRTGLTVGPDLKARALIVITSGSPTTWDYGIVLKRQDASNFLLAQITTAVPAGLRLFEKRGGTFTQIANTAATLSIPAYLVARQIGDVVSVEAWPISSVLDPSQSVPTATLSTTLTGATKTAFGSGVSGTVGLRVSPPGAAFTHGVDEFTVVKYGILDPTIF